MGPSGLVEAVAVKAAEGMKVVVVQGVDRGDTYLHAPLVVFFFFRTGGQPNRRLVLTGGCRKRERRTRSGTKCGWSCMLYDKNVWFGFPLVSMRRGERAA